MNDLCTLTDVKGEYPLPTALNTMVKNKIPQLTIDIYEDLKLTELPVETDKQSWMKMICVYRILIWLEGKGLIKPSASEISSMNDGDFSVSYGNRIRSTKTDIPRTNEEWHSYYMRKFVSRPPVGNKCTTRRRTCYDL